LWLAVELLLEMNLFRIHPWIGTFKSRAFPHGHSKSLIKTTAGGVAAPISDRKPHGFVADHKTRIRKGATRFAKGKPMNGQDRDRKEAVKLHRKTVKRPATEGPAPGGADIENRRENTGDELRKANEYLENIFENSPDGIGIVDDSGKLIKWNKMAAQQYGYTFQELKGKSVFDLYADKRELDRMLTELRREHAVKKYAIKMKKKDGTSGIFEISISLLKDDAERVVGSVCVARDLSEIRNAMAALKGSNERLQREISERERTEGTLRDSRERLCLALESGRAGTWDRDIIADRPFWDDHTHKLFGLAPGTFSEKHEDLLKMVHPDDRDRVRAEMAAALSEAADFTTTYRVIWPDSSVHFIADRGKVHRDSAGRAVRMTGVNWDFTELCARAKSA